MHLCTKKQLNINEKINKLSIYYYTTKLKNNYTYIHMH